jgi:hypothetical protein
VGNLQRDTSGRGIGTDWGEEERFMSCAIGKQGIAAASGIRNSERSRAWGDYYSEGYNYPTLDSLGHFAESLSTVPVRVTTPSFVSTLTIVARRGLWAANCDFTLAVNFTRVILLKQSLLTNARGVRAVRGDRFPMRAYPPAVSSALYRRTLLPGRYVWHSCLLFCVRR